MRLLVINKTIRDKVRGFFEDHQMIEPIKIKDDIYILNLDAMLRIKPKLKKAKYWNLDGVAWFTVGNGGVLDLKYQNYLIKQQESNDWNN